MRKYEIAKKHELENNHELSRELWKVYANIQNTYSNDRHRASRLLVYRDEDYSGHRQRSKKQIAIALEIVKRYYPEAECLKYYSWNTEKINRCKACWEEIESEDSICEPCLQWF